MQSQPLLAPFLKSRGTLIELVLAAVVLALGINLLATSIAVYFQDAAWSLALFGTSLSILSITFIARRTFASNHIERELNGFVCFRPKTSELISIPRYEYVEEIERYLKALFSENDAPQKLWESDPVHKSFEIDPNTGKHKHRTTAAGQLLIEATEYFVLENLSTHLTDYFNHSDIDSAHLHELTREDVATVVFSNRFLDTFSRPMNERSAFVDNTLGKNSKHGTVVAAFGKGGVRYSKFDLVLPSGAKVFRSDKHSISIDAPKFLLTMRVNFGGYGTNLPRGFSELYIGNLSFPDVSTYKIGITTTVQFKPFALLSRAGWEYHQWLDSFLEKLERDFSKRAFLDHIQWNTAITAARVVERTLSKRRENDAPPEATAGA